jgi:hypothetical protein
MWCIFRSEYESSENRLLGLVYFFLWASKELWFVWKWRKQYVSSPLQHCYIAHKQTYFPLSLTKYDPSRSASKSEISCFLLGQLILRQKVAKLVKKITSIILNREVPEHVYITIFLYIVYSPHSTQSICVLGSSCLLSGPCNGSWQKPGGIGVPRSLTRRKKETPYALSLRRIRNCLASQSQTTT